ncbi:hypothetical protein F506_19790 [Herbaspirillum hiltneri N3]|uniref:HTH lysR-type domain-containing protein n=1 Tax=Herbaspirillum hiltneri N3 TaxID=1262470 RepID=A0ABN4I0G8_9BURK|nr:hypothetical protein F506_19790 [Herbaspirillum hiltneri N3]
MRYFLSLARGGSLSAAARELAVEHSTVSRRIGALEGTIRLRLFDRLPRGRLHRLAQACRTGAGRPGSTPAQCHR